MNISPETKPISEIFSINGTDKYSIPIYQRNYSWEFNQIETLFNDIKDEEEGYYIGNLLISKNDTDLLEIVDGQQRLTTIALMLVAIYQFLNTGFNGKFDQRIGAIKFDIKRQLLFKGDIEKPRYKLSEYDQEAFISLIKKYILELDVKIQDNKKFTKKYFRIYQLISEEFYNNFNELDNFYSNKLINIKILRITVNNLSDAYSVFSSLNSKGMPLSLIDLLKNEFLKISTNNNSSKKSLDSWNNLLSLFEQDGETNTKNVTQFLLYNYDTYESLVGSSITKNRALNEYIKIIKNEPINYVNKLIQRANWFLYLKNQTDKVHSNNYVNDISRTLSYLDTAQAFPLLMYLFDQQENLKLEDNDLIIILKKVRNFFIIRNVTQRPKASNIRAIYLNLNRKIRTESLSAKEIISVITKTIKAESDSVDEFKNRLLENGIYDKNPSTARLILIELERSKTSYFNKSNIDSLEDYVIHSKNKTKQLQWSIEHILPQGDLPNHWISKLGSDYEVAKDIQERNVHKLGNLTLTPYNSEQGQKSFIEKRDIKDSNNFVGLRLGLYINNSIKKDDKWEDQTTWNESDINRRNNNLVNEIIDLFELNIE